MPVMNDIFGVILGGGRGTRLYPLTRQRAKPAVPFGGKYRLIDVPLSNCINAGILRMAVLTQFKSVSLHRHISRTYRFDAFSPGWVQILAAEQRTRDTDTDWYQGTADAVRKQLLEIQTTDAKYVMILAGDHLYRMNFDEMAAFHWENGADITVAVQPVLKEDGSRFGLLKVAGDGQITDFAEKPKDAETQKHFISRDDAAKPFLGSMGIYMFKTQVLADLLSQHDDTDFGGEVIPRAIKDYVVYGYNFDGFWRDIGTIRSFYDTNLDLTKPEPLFNFHHPTDPIYTRPRFLPGSIFEASELDQVLLAEGSSIRHAKVRNSIVGLRSQISNGAEVAATILMGADYYDTPESIAQAGGIPIGVGEDSRVNGAIIDKNVRIGRNVVVEPFPLGTEQDGKEWVVRDGIVVIRKNAILADGTYIGPK